MYAAAGAKHVPLKATSAPNQLSCDLSFEQTARLVFHGFSQKVRLQWPELGWYGSSTLNKDPAGKHGSQVPGRNTRNTRRFQVWEATSTQFLKLECY